MFLVLCFTTQKQSLNLQRRNMKTAIFFLITFGLVFASDIVRYNPTSGGVTNRVTVYQKSVDTASLAGQTNLLINPTVPTNNLPNTWKVTDGTVVVMTAGELSSVVTFEQTQSVNAKKSEMLSIYTADQSAQEIAHRAAVEAIIKLTVDQLNTVRTNPTASLPVITYSQARNVFLTELTNRMNQITQ